MAKRILLLVAADWLSIADQPLIGDLSDDGLNDRRAGNKGKEVGASYKLSGTEERDQGPILRLCLRKEG